MEKHCENAMKVATHLSKHPKIEWVRYPGLSRDPMHRLQKTYLKGKGLCGNQPLRRVHAGVASMAWRMTRRFSTNAVKF